MLLIRQVINYFILTVLYKVLVVMSLFHNNACGNNITDFRVFQNFIEDEFRILLASLPKDNVQECVNHFTSKALLEGKVEEERVR